MKPFFPTIGAAALCVTCGTAASAVYFSLIALLCWFISSGFAASTNNSTTWEFALVFGSLLGLAAGLVYSIVLTLIASWSIDLPTMRKKFASQFTLVLLAGALFAAAVGTYSQWDLSHGGTFVVTVARPQGHSTQTAVANLVFVGAVTGVISAVFLCTLWPFIRTSAVVSNLRDLLLPFNVAKYLVIAVSLIGTIWGLCLPSSNLFLATYKLSFGSVMWGAAMLYLCDFSAAMTGHSSPYWQKFYAENKTDLYVCGFIGLTLVLVMSRSSDNYSWYSLDLAFLGLPFFLYAIFAIHECATIKVAGRKLPLRVRAALCALFAGLYAITVVIVLNVQSKTMPEYEALWYQISIFCAGLFSLIFARQIPYMLKHGLEPSPILLDMFSSIKFSPGIYAAAARAAQDWNHRVKLEKAALRKEKARASKRKRR